SINSHYRRGLPAARPWNGYGDSGLSANKQLWLGDHLIREKLTVSIERSWPESAEQWMELLEDVKAGEDNLLVLIFNRAPDNCGNNAFKVNRRARKMLQYLDLEAESGSHLRLVEAIKKGPGSFSSRGESFAWQLVTGFLCHILPLLSQRVSSQLADKAGTALPEALRRFNAKGVDARRVLVVPKYFLLLSKPVACGQKQAELCPDQLFPGCQKISDWSSELEFDSPGFKKRIPVYLTELREPLPSGHTHAMIFCGFAAPIFIMRQLELSKNERGEIFDDFVCELSYILSHPSSSQLFCDLGGAATGATGSESSTVSLIELAGTGGDSIRNQVLERIDEYLEKRDWDACDDLRDEWVLLVLVTSLMNLSVKFSSSFTTEVKSSVRNWLSRLGFRTNETAVDSPLLPSQRVLLLLHIQDLESNDERMHTQIRHAVENMHRSDCQNIFVIIETAPGEHQAAFKSLPNILRCLPDKCTAAVTGLKQLSSLKFSFPDGTQRLAGFSDLIKAFKLDSKPDCADECLPLTSMSFAMAANCWFGFANRLLQSMNASTGRNSKPMFDPPYCFVIPSSGRFPDENQLYDQLYSIGVRWSVSEFRLEGRRFTFRVHRWGDVSIAFEVPASVLSIHRQADSRIGGVRAKSLSSQLAEFGAELDKYCANSGGWFRVIRWDDSVLRVGAECPDLSRVESLMSCLGEACSIRP
uniref:Death domain-containing protein n=1 Tax=Macrostomum lignano TaxID=282301 RepID=A0A1I8HHQ4_9PLAT